MTKLRVRGVHSQDFPRLESLYWHVESHFPRWVYGKIEMILAATCATKI